MSSKSLHTRYLEIREILLFINFGQLQKININFRQLSKSIHLTIHEIL